MLLPAAVATLNMTYLLLIIVVAVITMIITVILTSSTINCQNKNCVYYPEYVGKAVRESESKKENNKSIYFFYIILVDQLIWFKCGCLVN